MIKNDTQSTTRLKAMLYKILIISLLTALHAVPALAAKSTGISRLGFAIQMGAFAELKNAERFTAKLQVQGLDAFYYRKDNGIYAVRFGDFPSKEKARAVASKLVKDRLIDTYYIAPPNEVVFSKPLGPGWQKPRPDEFKAPPEIKRPVAVRPADPGPKLHPRTAAKDDREMGSIAARTAERFMGIPYRWGVKMWWTAWIAAALYAPSTICAA